MIFRQLFDHESSTYTYLVADASTKDATIIDPVIEQVDRDLTLIRELGLQLKMILETHIHADHVTGSWELKQATKAEAVAGAGSKLACADRLLKDKETIRVGSLEFQALATPGHTDSCMSYYGHGRVFTGDALLIRGCGRTDFQQGSSKKLFHSIRNVLFRLPDETLVFPAHDYKGMNCSSIGEEKAHNPRLNLHIGEDEFVQIMASLNLSPPKKIAVAVPRNQSCGQPL